uniref:C2H2-type domain-containing protein n=1 Tax=Strigamia maritima TaxID=126957 RepID=T1JEM3_STRMM
MAENNPEGQNTTSEIICESYSDDNLSIKNLKCILCTKNFSTMGNMRRHLRNIHKEDTSNLIANAHMKCPVCTEYACARTVELYKHLATDHGIRLEIDHNNFTTTTEFYKWKSEMEAETNSSYFKPYGTSRFNDGTEKAIYYCSRSGIYKPRGTGKRALKTQGSRKLNAACPAKITVITNRDKTIAVEFVKTHCGHTLDELKHLSLTKNEKLEIAKKLELGVDSNEILNDVRQTSSPVKRKHLLTKKDIYNIKRSHNISENAANQNDFVSIQFWINEGEFPQGVDVHIVEDKTVKEESVRLKQDEIVKNALLQSARQSFEEMCA